MSFNPPTLPKGEYSHSVLIACMVFVVASAALAACWGSVPVMGIGIGLLAIIGWVFCSEAIPFLLIAATVVMPFSGNLSGQESDARGILVAFGFTDLLLFAALPGVFRLAWLKRQSLISALPRSARRCFLWTFAFLAVCTVSFLLNRHTMADSVLIYAAGWFRTFQMVFLIPLAFAVAAWKPYQFRWLWTGYLCAVLFFCVSVTGMYFVGAGTLPVFDVHKNVVGLIVATGVLIALVSWWSEEKAKLVPSVLAEILLVLGMPALTAANSRISIIACIVGIVALSFHFRKIRLPLLLIGFLSVLIPASVLFAPKWARTMDVSLSMQTPSIRERVSQYQASMDRFRQSPLFGDGLRARKDIQPHNAEIVLLTETGVLGLFTFAGVAAAIVALFHDTFRLIGEKSVFTGTLWALAVCCLAVFVHIHSDPFWRRGPLWFMGASVGICCSVLRRDDENSHTAAVNS